MQTTAQSKPHVLVVEDDPGVASLMTDALSIAGFEVSTVAAAEDALGLAVMDVPFDALLTDIDLAGPINGWELAETLREMRPDLPVIYTSGRARATSAVVPDAVFVPKPYSPFGICRLLQQLCAAAKRDAAATLVPAATDWLGRSQPVLVR
jgi:DNA-binding NtrC family response regulator